MCLRLFVYLMVVLGLECLCVYVFNDFRDILVVFIVDMVFCFIKYLEDRFFFNTIFYN